MATLDSIPQGTEETGLSYNKYKGDLYSGHQPQPDLKNSP